MRVLRVCLLLLACYAVSVSANVPECGSTCLDICQSSGGDLVEACVCNWGGGWECGCLCSPGSGGTSCSDFGCYTVYN